MARGVVTLREREYLRSGKIVMAIIRTAADLERLLAYNLFLTTPKFKAKKIETWGLRKFIDNNLKHGLIDKKHKKMLMKFNELRDRTVHYGVFSQKLLKTEEALKLVKKLILSVCDFIDKTRISYKITEESEKQYMEYGKKGTSFDFLKDDY